MAAETLSQRYFYSFRGFGDSIYCDCYDAVADAFLADPLHVPDSSCVDAFSPLQFVPPAT